MTPMVWNVITTRTRPRTCVGEAFARGYCLLRQMQIGYDETTIDTPVLMVALPFAMVFDTVSVTTYVSLGPSGGTKSKFKAALGTNSKNFAVEGLKTQSRGLGRNAN
jgi:hypothetical protein